MEYVLSKIVDQLCVIIVPICFFGLIAVFIMLKVVLDTCRDIIAEKLERKCFRAEDRGYIRPEELRSCEVLYKRYRKLRGNSYIDNDIMPKIRGFKVKKE